MKKILLAAMAAMMLTSCLDNSKYYASSQLEIVFDNFRDLGGFDSADQEICVRPFCVGPIYFYNIITDDVDPQFVGGTAIARLADTTLFTRTTPLPHMTVWGNPADKESVAYSNYYVIYRDDSDTLKVPVCAFNYIYAQVGACAISSVEVNNTIENVASAMDANPNFAYNDGDWLKVSFTTYLKEKFYEPVELYLVDFRDSQKKVVTEWTKVDLSAMGNMEYMKVEVTSNREDAPRYVCLDNILGKYSIGSSE